MHSSKNRDFDPWSLKVGGGIKYFEHHCTKTKALRRDQPSTGVCQPTDPDEACVRTFVRRYVLCNPAAAMIHPSSRYFFCMQVASPTNLTIFVFTTITCC
jgi:hypothetical protein